MKVLPRIGLTKGSIIYICKFQFYAGEEFILGKYHRGKVYDSVEEYSPLALGLAKFFRVKSAGPHVEIWVKR